VWNNAKQQRLDDLRQRAQRGSLTADEQRTLERLLHEVEQAEWTSLRPALNQARHEQSSLRADLSQLQAQNVALATVAEQYADLLARVRVQLANLLDEREALRTEYERALH